MKIAKLIEELRIVQRENDEIEVEISAVTEGGMLFKDFELYANNKGLTFVEKGEGAVPVKPEKPKTIVEKVVDKLRPKGMAGVKTINDELDECKCGHKGKDFVKDSKGNAYCGGCHRREHLKALNEKKPCVICGKQRS